MTPGGSADVPVATPGAAPVPVVPAAPVDEEDEPVLEDPLEDDEP